MSSDERYKLAEACRFLDIVWRAPWKGPTGFLTMEEIRAWLGISQRGAYKLIRVHLLPRGGVYRQGLGRHGRAGRLLVATKAFVAYLQERERRPRRAGLVTHRRWTRSGPRPVEPKPRRAVPQRRPWWSPMLTFRKQAEATYLWEHVLSPEERKAIIAKVLRRQKAKQAGGIGRGARRGDEEARDCQ